MKRVSLSRLGLVLVLAIAGCASQTTSVSQIRRATVVDVVDGDTIRARIGANVESIRLIGIDTPETKHPTKGVQCFGPQASLFLTRFLPSGTEIRIERDAQARDAYGRLLLYVFRTVDDTELFVNREIVLRGFARLLTIEPNSRYHEVFVQAAFAAQQHARGLWRACK